MAISMKGITNPDQTVLGAGSLVGSRIKLGRIEVDYPGLSVRPLFSKKINFKATADLERELSEISVIQFNIDPRKKRGVSPVYVGFDFTTDEPTTTIGLFKYEIRKSKDKLPENRQE